MSALASRTNPAKCPGFLRWDRFSSITPSRLALLRLIATTGMKTPVVFVVAACTADSQALVFPALHDGEDAFLGWGGFVGGHNFPMMA